MDAAYGQQRIRHVLARWSECSGHTGGVLLNPQTLLRGLVKFVAVVLAAGLAGAAIGIGLAKLSGNEATSDPVIPASTAGTATTPERTATTAASTGTTSTPARKTSTAAATTSTTTAAATPSDGVYRVPRVEVLSAELGPASVVTGRALVRVRARVTNRGTKPLAIKTPALLAGDVQAPLGDAARKSAGALLEPIAIGATATGVLRFTVTSVVAQRLNAKPGARLRLANRTVSIKLKPSAATG
jgi:hypothetical protein